MTVKNFQVDSTPGYGTVSDTYGGQQLQIMASPDIHSLLTWWREWQPVFSSMNPHVQDALQQARVMHALSKEQ
jgi:hypothetical protein